MPPVARSSRSALAAAPRRRGDELVHLHGLGAALERDQQTERRTFSFESRGKLRAGDGDSPPHFSGYASVFDQETVIYDFWGPYREKIAPGAFTRSIASADDLDNTALLIGHDANPTMVLARKASRTLSLGEDSHGLKVDADLDPEQTTANDLIRVMKRGDVNQMSFGFYVTKQTWQFDELDPSNDLRIIEECQLFDVSPVTYPAYPTTSAYVRSVRTREQMEGRLEARGSITPADETRDADAVIDDFHATFALLGQLRAELASARESRAGKVLSADNQEAIETAVEAVETAIESAEEAIESLEAVLEAAGVGDPDVDTPDADDAPGATDDPEAESKSSGSAAAADTTDAPAASMASVDLRLRKLRLLELEGGRSGRNLR